MSRRGKRRLQRFGAERFASPRLKEWFAKLTAPSLVVSGANDKLFASALAKKFTARIARAAVQLIPDAGHFPQIDNPEATITVIAGFLK